MKFVSNILIIVIDLEIIVCYTTIVITHTS